MTWNSMKSFAHTGMVSSTSVRTHHAIGMRSNQLRWMSALLVSTSAMAYLCPNRPCGRKASTAAMIRKVKTTE